MSLMRSTVVLAVFGSTLLSACEPQPNSNLGQPVANTIANNSNANLGTESKTTEPITGAPFTMAMLDALLADETFSREARTAAQLTDEEMDKLRTRARNAVQELSGDDVEDGNRSTAASTNRAVAEVKKILGDERGNKLIALVQKKWIGDSNASKANPGSIPTDTRIIVNIPAYRMDIFESGKILRSYKIGIGYPEFPLPTGIRKAEKIVFNPTWTPPDEPWVKDKVSPGKTIGPGDKLNPLGPIKIPIGLPSLIHGGKSASRLGTFASHGCVGLTDGQVQDLAIELSKLSGNPLTLDDIKRYEKNGSETREVKLGIEIPVELRYETIVVENGAVKIYRDVYQRGTNTPDNLSLVLSEYGVNFDTLDPAVKEKMLGALKEMAQDALGKPVDGETNSNSRSNANTNSSGSVTKNIKGRKEIIIPVLQLSGKGYPTPVAMRAN